MIFNNMSLSSHISIIVMHYAFKPASSSTILLHLIAISGERLLKLIANVFKNLDNLYQSFNISLPDR
jgi:hypothetical protein